MDSKVQVLNHTLKAAQIQANELSAFAITIKPQEKKIQVTLIGSDWVKLTKALRYKPTIIELAGGTYFSHQGVLNIDGVEYEAYLNELDIEELTEEENEENDHPL